MNGQGGLLASESFQAAPLSPRPPLNCFQTSQGGYRRSFRRSQRALEIRYSPVVLKRCRAIDPRTSLTNLEGLTRNALAISLMARK
jgi:hypothetical protein